MSLAEVPLARLWLLPDGTTCLLLKDGRTENWELRVVREGATLRSEHFGNPLVAMDAGKSWRSEFDAPAQPSA